MKLDQVQKPDYSNLYSSKEIAEFMGISCPTLFRLVKGGKIKVRNIAYSGKKPIYRFAAEDVQAYYDRTPDPKGNPTSLVGIENIRVAEQQRDAAGEVS